MTSMEKETEEHFNLRRALKEILDLNSLLHFIRNLLMWISCPPKQKMRFQKKKSRDSKDRSRMMI